MFVDEQPTSAMCNLFMIYSYLFKSIFNDDIYGLHLEYKVVARTET